MQTMELWDIYDENKERTGRTMKHNDWNMKPGEFHLTVLGVLMRPDGKYLITRRRMDKEWAAGWWEVPGGGVRAGEDSKDAVIREIKEETGIDVTNAEGGYAFSYKRVNPEEKNNYFVDIYKFVLEFDESDVKTQEEYLSILKIARFQGFTWARENHLNHIEIPFPNILNFYCAKTVTYRNDEKTLCEASEIIEDEEKIKGAVKLVRTFAKKPDRTALTDSFIESLKLLADTVERQMEEVK